MRAWWIAALLGCVMAADGHAQVRTSAPRALFLDDFEDGDLRLKTGGRWIAYDDTLAGGRSKLVAAPTSPGAAGSRRALRLAPTFQPGFARPFAGVQGYLNAQRAPTDMSSYHGVSFWARGAGVFQFNVMTGEVVDHNYFTAGLQAGPTWKRYTVPFSSLRQSIYFGRMVKWNPRSIRGVGFHLDQGNGAGTIEIDQVLFY